MNTGSSIPSRNNKYSFILISLLAALAIQAIPVLFKSWMDNVFSLDFHGWSILASLTLLQMAVTTLPRRIGALCGGAVIILGFLMSLPNVMNIGIFKSPISIITFATTLHSNVSETTEFLNTYGYSLALTSGLYLILGLVVTLLYFRTARPQTLKPTLFLMSLALVATLPSLLRSGGQLKQVALDFHELAYVDRLATTFTRYQGVMQAREKARTFWKQRSEARNPLELRHTKPKLPSLVVVVIGESTTRRHMGIYGYHRPTTPSLESMKDRLVVFTQGTAPVASTLPGVIGAFCSRGFDPASLHCEGPTMIEIARAAGYKTTWISNQAPSGFGDNFIVELGRTTDTTYFVNQDVSSAGEADNSSSFDEKVLDPLHQVIDASQKTGEKQMIFVHLMGTHFIYEKRYPKAERRFTDTDDIPIPNAARDAKARSIINHYDNAVAYQDKVLGSIMDRLNAAAQDSLFVYFSDHGEEVYNSDNFAGHSEDRVTPAMREVPFIIGYSQAHAAQESEELQFLRQKAAKPFSTFQLTPTVAGLLGLEGSAWNARDNIVEGMRASSSSRSGPPYLQK
ncbi:MAG TPA: phosphoethanolamine transferase [Oligoflexus sp.]|uniref:phosphoethanolamine transferase n=1 Tax=Oligoflexus sp. TaxID=1971216 RepID=UPI002D7FA45D|nr:phosphoethanolamine transferase [Oligoflexus sp.]HET9239763.1 phosphoethanolamine transferase [Oligoflexus sp.]